MKKVGIVMGSDSDLPVIQTPPPPGKRASAC